MEDRRDQLSYNALADLETLDILSDCSNDTDGLVA